MGQESALLWFFGLLVVLLIIVLVFIIMGFMRTRRPVGGSAHGGPKIDEQQQSVAERLGESNPKQYGADPRGDDIGGNFSTSVSGDENKGETR